MRGARTLTAFDGGGIIGKTDVAGKQQTAYTAVVQPRSGKWVRVFPSKKGTFDCTPSNHVEFAANLAGT